MATKVPGAPILTNAPTPSTQPTPSNVTSSPVFNNNNNKMSGVATSIITAPLMSQAQCANSMQKQSANNATVTTGASPAKPVTTSRVTVGGPGSTSSVTGTTASPSISTTGSKPSDTIKSGTTGPTGPVEVKKAEVTTANITSSTSAVGSVPAPKGSTAASVTTAAPSSVSSTKQPDIKTTELSSSNITTSTAGIVGPTTAPKGPSVTTATPPTVPATKPPDVKKPEVTSANIISSTSSVAFAGAPKGPPASSITTGTPSSVPSTKPSDIKKAEVPPSNISSSSASTATPAATTPKPPPAASATTATPSSVPSLSKPTDLNKSTMNGGATVILKQPPPPVTVLPPTPVATPPSIHRQTPQPPTNPPASSKNGSTNDQILSKTNDMNKSIYISSSNDEPIIGNSEKSIMSGNRNTKEPEIGGGDAKRIMEGMDSSIIGDGITGKSEKQIVSGNQYRKEDGIGDDVKRIMEAIENAGLCGPKIPENGYGKSSAKEGAKELNGTKSNLPRNQSNREMTSNGTRNRSLSRPGTASSPVKGQTSDSPTKSRPSTASSVSRKDHHAAANGVSGIPTLKSPKEKVAPASGASNGSPGSLPPKTTTSASGLRTSTSRVASAKVNTAPATTNKTPNENKNSKAKVGADSCSASPVETETGLSSATGSRSTPRLRPSSSLYRPTASSALKGVSSAPHNTTSNHNLSPSSSTPRSRSSTGARTSRSAITMGDSAGGSGDGKPATIREQFAAFARFGNKEEDGKHITLSNCDKWMKQAKVIDGKKITTTDTSICFKKLFKTAKKITFEDFKKYVEELAKSKKMEPQELLDKLANSGAPGLSSATRAAHSNVVDRLTDTSKYTGSHKERFDATGKGRGIEGRKDVSDGSGYVAAFKEKLDLKDGEGKKEEGTSASPTPAK